MLGSFSVHLTGQSLGGNVTGPDDEPLAGASVTIEGTFTGVHTDSGGTYLLSGLKAGNYTVRFSFMGYEPEIRKIDVAGDVREDVRLKPKAIITDDVIISATRGRSTDSACLFQRDRRYPGKKNSGQGLPYLLSLTPSFVETSESGNGIGYTSRGSGEPTPQGSTLPSMGYLLTIRIAAGILGRPARPCSSVDIYPGPKRSGNFIEWCRALSGLQ
jgi:hypothetical protein